MNVLKITYSLSLNNRVVAEVRNVAGDLLAMEVADTPEEAKELALQVARKKEELLPTLPLPEEVII